MMSPFYPTSPFCVWRCVRFLWRRIWMGHLRHFIGNTQKYSKTIRKFDPRDRHKTYIKNFKWVFGKLMGGKIGVVRKMDFLCCIIFEEEKFTYFWDDDKKKNTLFFTTIRLSPKKFANELLIKLYFLYFAKNACFPCSPFYNNCAVDKFGYTRCVLLDFIVYVLRTTFCLI